MIVIVVPSAFCSLRSTSDEPFLPSDLVKAIHRSPSQADLRSSRVGLCHTTTSAAGWPYKVIYYPPCDCGQGTPLCGYHAAIQ